MQGAMASPGGPESSKTIIKYSPRKKTQSPAAFAPIHRHSQNLILIPMNVLHVKLNASTAIKIILCFYLSNIKSSVPKEEGE